MPNPKPSIPISPIWAYHTLDILVCQALNTAQKMQKNITKRYNNITKCYNTKPKYPEIWEKINGVRNVLYMGDQGYFSIPAPAGPPPAAGYLTKIVMSSTIIVLGIFEKSNIGIWLPFWPDPFLMVWEYLTKDTRFGILQTFWRGYGLMVRNVSFSGGYGLAVRNV